jgi:hypothetical protein
MGKCLRAAYYEKTGEKKTEKSSDQLELMAYMGNMIEDGLIDMLKNMGLWVANNVKWYNEERDVSGEIDVIIKSSEDSKDLYNVECKSCSGYHINKEVFGYMSGRAPNKRFIQGRPKIKHLMQAALYCDATKGKCKGTILIYFSRDESRMKEFEITTDEKGLVYVDGIVDPRFTLGDVYDSYEVLDRFLDSKRLPPKDYRPYYTDKMVEQLFEDGKITEKNKKEHLDGTSPYMDEECDYCSYRTKCLSEQNEIKGLSQFCNHGSL